MTQKLLGTRTSIIVITFVFKENILQVMFLSCVYLTNQRNIRIIQIAAGSEPREPWIIVIQTQSFHLLILHALV